MNDTSLLKEKVPSETELKEIIVSYVGNKINPESEDITIEQVIEVFSTEFPEFLFAMAEENWINGYTQALNDVRFSEKNKTKNEEIHSKKKQK